ncbi:tether containing UBX domain for GLUT4 [Protopterus annectens]|uniref:tether containing UBX domain for GLUT4 n=1 Tax=Protopterus annectens TaxID=7888 RepID=UPI001CFA71B7|nr:tether containing UBX domain for GLUT4 [Protopterus annectens]
MAAYGAVTVSVLAPNGRRQTVKVGSSTPLLKILEEVCRKQNFTPEDYDLKFQRTVLDLSQQWRFANLPNNAKLEMVTVTHQRAPEIEKMVRIALQLEDGSRLQTSLACTQTLWEVLCHFPETRILEPEMQDSVPLCIYMRDEIVGEAALKATTLKSLGLTGGTAIIRYIQKKSSESDVRRNTEIDVAGNDQLMSKAQSGVLQVELSSPVVEISMSEAEEMESVKETPALCVKDTLAKQEEKSKDVEVMKDTDIHSESHAERGEMETVHRGMDIEVNYIFQKTEAKQEEKVVRSKDQVEDVSSSVNHISKEEHKPMESQAGLSVGQTEYSFKERKLELATSSQKCAFVPFSGCGQRLGSSVTDQESSDKVLQSSSQVSVASPEGSPKLKKPKTKVEGQCDSSQTIERELLVYHLDMDDPLRDELSKELDKELPEDFLEVTVDDVRKRFAQLRSERQRFEDAPLMTKALRETQSQEKMLRYPKVVLRVQFPDRYILQGFFQPTETVENVKEFVKQQLASPDLSFYLFVTPPKIILEDMTVTLFQANLFPAAVVHFGSPVKKHCYLKSELLEFVVSPSQADISVASLMPRSDTTSSSPSTPEPTSLIPTEVDTVVKESSMSSAGEESSDQEACTEAPKPKVTDPSKVPKWLKLPGKRLNQGE